MNSFKELLWVCAWLQIWSNIRLFGLGFQRVSHDTIWSLKCLWLKGLFIFIINVISLIRVSRWWSSRWWSLLGWHFPRWLNLCCLRTSISRVWRRSASHLVRVDVCLGLCTTTNSTSFFQIVLSLRFNSCNFRFTLWPTLHDVFICKFLYLRFFIVFHSGYHRRTFISFEWYRSGIRFRPGCSCWAWSTSLLIFHFISSFV